LIEEIAVGTLFNQEPRNYRLISPDDLRSFLESATHLAKEFNISVSDVIQAKKALEMERQNSLYVANGDAFDEQLAGLGEILQDLVSAIESLKTDE
jgi:hypothetical protein